MRTGMLTMLLKKCLSLFISLILFTPISQAESIWHSRDWKKNIVLAIAGGPAWAATGNNQSFLSQNTNYYNNSSTTDSLGIGEVFIGTYKELTNTLQLQFGVELAGSGNITEGGVALQNEKTVYSYSYTVNQFRAAAKGKLVMEEFPVIAIIQPFIAGSIGLGMNHSYNYATSTMTAPAFSNSTVYTFAYTIGGGLQCPLDPFYQLGVGYELSGWGKSQLGATSGQTVGTGIAIDNIYTNAIIISLTYTS